MRNLDWIIITWCVVLMVLLITTYIDLQMLKGNFKLLVTELGRVVDKLIAKGY